LSGKAVTDRMFTIEQINDLHDRLGTMETFSQFVRALKSAGVETYDSYLVDGHSEYFGRGGHTVKSPAAHKKLTVADTSNREAFLEHLSLHNQHKTSYLEMSRGLAESGIEKWTVDANRMTVTFYDKACNELLVEVIE
jgi:uncharacterized protein YbcV (DUF1398 family)